MAEKYGKWINKRQLGKGGQAQTYLVVEEGNDSDERFVLKRLNTNRIERAKSEIEAYKKLSHPNVVRLIDYDLNSPKPYLVTEYCEGGDLSKLDPMAIPIIERLRLFVSICRGVGHAHENGVVHRDLKPDNIFLRLDGRTPVVGDFGICFIDDDGERVTLIDEAAGPRWFIAPELEDGRSEMIRPASDVYSLGKLLYWLISGKKFTREKHRDPNFDLTKESGDASVSFIYGLLDKTINLDPLQRLKNANELANETDLIIRRLLMHAHPIDMESRQHCTYCGIGNYQKMTTPDEPQHGLRRVHNFFPTMSSNPYPWLILLCDYCGNVQLFRPDLNPPEQRGVWTRRK